MKVSTAKLLILNLINKLDRQFFPATDGNVSIRTKEGLVITPKGWNKLKLRFNDLIYTQFDNINPNTSSEVLMHIQIYKKRENINVILHTHHPSFLKLAYKHRPIEPVIDELKLFLGKIPVSEYAPPGSMELAINVEKALKNFKGVIMKKHGAVFVARNTKEILYTIKRALTGAEIYEG